MALKIIGAGYGRTGTKSLYTALNQLGFPCYHMEEVLGNKNNKSHLDFWVDVSNGEPGQQFDWEQVFANYTAAVDFPASSVWKELMEHYPDAKIILTGHPKGAGAWYESANKTIYAIENIWQFKLLKIVTPFARKLGKLGKLMWQRTLKGSMENKEEAVVVYEAHMEEVIANVPSDKLLNYSVTQGWEPLCEFLDVPVPLTEFPNVNDTKEFRENTKRFVFAAYVILGVGALILLGLLYLLL